MTSRRAWKKAICAVTQHSSPEHLGFGPNEWLVDELYQQYLTDRNSVDRAWWDFFADYHPSEFAPGALTLKTGPATDGADAAAPPKPATPSPAMPGPATP